MDEDAWRKGFEIDVMGTVFGIEAALPFLEQSTAGSIVVVGSTAMAEVYGPTRSYAAVKATLIPYVKGLARNLAAKNVRETLDVGDQRRLDRRIGPRRSIHLGHRRAADRKS